MVYRKKIGLFFSFVFLILAVSGCGKKAPEMNGIEALQLLQENISFSTTLTREDGHIYFPNLPEESSVVRFGGSGYYADEIVLITMEDGQDQSLVRQAIENHLKELKNHFLSYIPDEADKIENAVIYETTDGILLCITDDYAQVQKLLESGNSWRETPVSTAQSEEAASEPTEQTAPETTLPHYPVLHSQEGNYYDYGNHTIRVDDSAFELYGYDASSADTYAGLVNRAAEKLKGETNVYALAIPTAIGVVLPDDIAQILPSYVDQGSMIDQIYGKMNPDVIPVRCFENLMAHRDEYLYFHTDYHWNGRGAYYAYESFCQTKGIKPIPLDERIKKEYGGFLGGLYFLCSGEDPTLRNNPDTVEAFCPRSSQASMRFTDSSGQTYDWNIIMDVSDWDAGTKYSTFAGADNPIAEFTNPEVTDQSVCVVVKESYGNALLPYLVDHYRTIYEIDYRYWEGDLIEFAREKGAEDLIFANNLTMISTDLLVGYLENIL